MVGLTDQLEHYGWQMNIKKKLLPDIFCLIAFLDGYQWQYGVSGTYEVQALWDLKHTYAIIGK